MWGGLFETLAFVRFAGVLAGTPLPGFIVPALAFLLV